MSIPSLDKLVSLHFGDEKQDVFYYWKGRVALFALLKAMGVTAGDEVILPAYTCVVVPNAILYMGAKPVYVDVSPDTYNMDVGKLVEKITDRTRVILCQNTYGLSTDLDKLKEIADEHGLYTIEDCTHGFGGSYEGVPNGLSCDAAFFSMQWNKPFSTGIGGFSIVRDEELRERLAVVNAELLSPSVKELINLKALYFVKRYLINDSTYWQMVRFYRWLSRNNLVVGSSSGEEISSVTLQEGYFKAFSDVQAKEGLRTLPRLNEDLARRKQNAHIYNQLLIEQGKKHVPPELFDNHAFLKFPLLVKERDKFIALAEQRRIELGDWFLTPLHPVKGDLSAWGYEYGEYPVAEYLARHVVNLPTTPRDVDRVMGFLVQNIGGVIAF